MFRVGKNAQILHAGPALKDAGFRVTPVARKIRRPVVFTELRSESCFDCKDLSSFPALVDQINYSVHQLSTVRKV